MRSGAYRLLLLVLLSLLALLLLLSMVQRSGQQTRLMARPETASRLGQQLSPKLMARPETASRLATQIQEQPLEEPVNDALVQQLEQELPEVDYGFWHRHARPQRYRMNSSCAQYADPLELQFHNTYWQTFLNANVTFRLYAAYLDDRLASKQPVVRVLGTANQIGLQFPRSYCQLWYAQQQQPIFVEVSEHLSVWLSSWSNKQLLSYPHLLSCPLPRQPALGRPRTVSLVTQHCQSASNSLRVNYARVQPQQPQESNATALSFGVCVKGFDFPYVDLTDRLIEWFEMQRILGAARIYAYMYDVHPRVQRVLDYYQRTGYLELRPLTMANGMPRLRHYQHILLQQRRQVKRLNELIPYNDCFYRNMHRHDYLLNVDVDEIIVPLGELRNWNELIKAALQAAPNAAKCGGNYAALCIINSHFTKHTLLPMDHEQQAADDLYVLQHTMRLKNYSLPGQATKCFHNTRYALTLHNHLATKWQGGCWPATVSTQLAHMQHYREQEYQLTDLVDDRSIWKYAAELRTQVDYVWTHLDDVVVLAAGELNEQATAEQLLLEDSTEQELAQQQQEQTAPPTPKA